jgi:hypothetical protein
METSNLNYRNVLIDRILEQATIFLKDAGEFYPFATIVDIQGNIKPMGVYFEDDNPTSSLIIEKLTTAIKDGIQSRTYLCGAVGIDVLVLEKGRSQKSDALEIRFYYESPSVEKTYYAYSKRDTGYVFREIDLC